MTGTSFLLLALYFLANQSRSRWVTEPHPGRAPFSTATRTTDWLLNNGYVQRLTDPNDRRLVVCVELTEAGKEL
jgi:DNA-binding PadR family transcriptional regulator